MAKIEDIVVLCDKPSDQKLFKYFQKNATNINKINEVHVLPGRDSLPDEYVNGMGVLLQYDRADYYFCYKGNPFLVLEMTEHGYTGDQCLQRFARISKTSESKIPFIYFSTFSRTRYDELDRENPSYRNVSANLYKGFVELMEIFESPVVALQWQTNEQGIPMVLAQNSASDTGLEELLKLLDYLLVERLDDMINKNNIMEDDVLLPHIETTVKLSKRDNVKVSQVIHDNVSFKNIFDITINPINSFNILPRKYFLSGKFEKLITLMCIENSKIDTLVLPSGKKIKFNNAEELEKFLPSDFLKKQWIFYHSGYQWRSEPNVGIITNIDIRKCRSKGGQTVKDRDKLLAVHWPRVFFNVDSTDRSKLISVLENRNDNEYFKKLVNEREVERNEPDAGNHTIASLNKAIGKWGDRATAARIFKDTCDLLILNDAIILGNMWGGK